ncbi:MAG: hypothetical protein HYV07_10105 [Deltaproteobacteria bacterium]|nr:hypothetical protein [Deltaproteobacteria bacterium]
MKVAVVLAITLGAPRAFAQEIEFSQLRLRDLIGTSPAIVVGKRAEPFVLTDGRQVTGKDGKAEVWSEARYRFVVTDVLAARPDLGGRLRGQTITVLPADMEIQFQAFSNRVKKLDLPPVKLLKYSPMGDRAFELDDVLILFVKPWTEGNYVLAATQAYESLEHRRMVEEAIDAVHAERKQKLEKAAAEGPRPVP